LPPRARQARAASGRRRWHLLHIEHFPRAMRLARLAELVGGAAEAVDRGGAVAIADCVRHRL
jgi:hypothetical protein